MTSPRTSVAEGGHDQKLDPFIRPRPDPLPKFPDDPIEPSAALGYLPGTAGVGADGAATYQIPLAVPPGVRGMQPELSLVYSSNSGNGFVGLGWSLVGASQIERCYKTIRTEGVADGFHFKDDDALCLNGAKLVQVGTTAEGPEYRTENSPFDRVVHNLSSDSFIVQSADGRIATYEARALPRTKVVDINNDGDENTSSQKLPPWRVHMEADGEVVLMWHLARVEDRFGNGMQYHYNTELHDSPELGTATSTELERITYTHHASAPNGATREVRLVPEDRPAEDRPFRYIKGVRLYQPRRLKRIEMWAPSTPSGQKEKQWEYRLDYRPSLSHKSGRSQLISVQQCDHAGDCGWKKEFWWQGQGLAFAIQPSYSTLSSEDPTPWAPYEPSPIWSRERRPILLDADGDGRQDILLLESQEADPSIPEEPPYQFKWKLLLSGDGYAPHTVSNDYFFDKYTGDLAPGHWRVADVNNDGRDDLIAGLDVGDDSISAHGGWFEYHCLTWNSLSDDFSACMAPETKDTSNSGEFHARWRGTDRQQWPLWNLADFNGDGRIDIVENDQIRLNMFTIGEQAFFIGSLHPSDLLDFDDAPNNETAWPWKAYNRGAEAFDLDGNGRADLILSDPPGVGVQTLAGPTYPLADDQIGLHALRLALDGSQVDSGVPGLGRGTVPWAAQTSQDIVFDASVGFFSVSADVNGDGLKDQVIVRHVTNLDYYEGPDLRWAGDDNFGGIGTYVQYNTGRGFTPAHRTTMQFRPIEGWLRYGPLMDFDSGSVNPFLWNTSALPSAVDVIDVNGDGRDDIVVKSMETWQWNPQQSELHLLDEPVWPPPSAAQDYENVNGGSTFWHTRIYVSTGDDFKLVENPFDPGLPTTVGDPGYIFARPAQLDDDPELEYITRGSGHSANGGSFPVEDWQDGITASGLRRVDLDAGPPELIWQIRDEGAVDAKEVFTYRNARFERTGSDCHYPISCPSSFPAVVDEHHSSQGRDRDGQPIRRRLKYGYGSPHVDVRGRGMLGFGQITTTDLDSGAITATFYEQSTAQVGDFFPYAGLPTKVKTITPILTASQDAAPCVLPGIVRVRMSTTTSVPAHKLLYGGKAYFAYASEQWTKVDELDMELELVDGKPYLYEVASPNPVAVSFVESTAQYDDFANPVHTTTIVTNGETRETTGTYLNDMSTWRIRLPLTQEATSKNVVRKVINHYDSKGHLDAIVVQPNDGPSVRSTTYRIRDERGLLIQVAQEAPNVPLRVTNLYYEPEQVHVAQIINPAGHQTATLRHPALGVPVLTEDELGVQRLAKYDGFGRLRSTDGPMSVDVAFVDYSAYWTPTGGYAGIQTTTGLTDGSVQKVITDEVGRPIRSAVKGFDGEMLWSATHFNQLGQAVSTTRMAKDAPSEHTSDVTYDTLGRPLLHSATDGVLTTFEHDPHESRTIDAKGHVRRVVFDAHRRPVLTEETLEVNGQPTVLATSFSYGAFDLLEKTTDPAGHDIVVRYDVLGRKLSIQDPDAGVTQFGYNGLGDLVSKTTPQGVIIETGHDELGRPVWVTDSDGTTIYTWDDPQYGIGRLAAALSPDDVLVRHEYDALGRLRNTRTTLDGAETFEIEQWYDTFGRIAQIAYPMDPSGKRFTAMFAHNEHGYAKSVSRSKLEPNNQPQTGLVWETQERDDDLSLVQGKLGNGLLTRFTRDPITGMVEKITTKAPLGGGSVTPKIEIGYQYDELRNVTKRTWSGKAFGDDIIGESFQYDELDRLTRWSVSGPVDGGSGVRNYRYDTMGNLTQVLHDATTVYTAQYGWGTLPNALSSSSQTSVFQYDVGGRQTQAGDRNVTFTDFDRPRSVMVGADITDFRYGPDGVRVEKTTADTRTIYIGGLYEKRITPESVQHVFFVPGEAGITAQVVRTETPGADITEAITYFTRDLLGSSSAAFHENGEAEAQVFDPWGARVYDSTSGSGALTSDVHHGFTDQRHEADLGWIDMNARMYDPAQRRFISPDPHMADPLFSTGRNRFAYVRNNPIRYSDPTGMDGVAEYHNTFNPKEASSKTVVGSAPIPGSLVTVPYGLNLPGFTWPIFLEEPFEQGDTAGIPGGEGSGADSSTQVAPDSQTERSTDWRENQTLQAARGAFVGAGMGALPGGAVIDLAATESGIVDRGEGTALRNKGLGQVLIGAVQIGLGVYLGGLGGGASATGVGAVVGVPVLTVAGALVANGTAAVLVGGRNINEALSTGGGSHSARVPTSEFPRKDLRGVSVRWLQRNKPNGWQKAPSDNGLGWKWLDENGYERLRFMRPNGLNPSANQWSRESNGYFRWQNAKGEYLDIDGNVVSPSNPLFKELTHIMYEGL